MSTITIYEALGLAPGQVYRTSSRGSSSPPSSRARYLSLFPPEYVKSNYRSTKMPARKPVPQKITQRLRKDDFTPPTERLESLLDATSDWSQILAPWPAGEVCETRSESSRDSGYGSNDDSFQRILCEFPDPPTAEPPKVSRISKASFQKTEGYLHDLKTWGWAEDAHLSGSTAFDVDWNTPGHDREVLVSPSNIENFNKATNNIVVINRRATKRNSGPLRTFFDDASIVSPTLHPNRWTLPAAIAASKRRSAMSRVRIAARRSAHMVNCFSSDDEDDDRDGRKGSTSTVSTIVSSIAEITDTVSQMKWRVYFAKMEERRRLRESRWTRDYNA